jgi:hypothetical protein
VVARLQQVGDVTAVLVEGCEDVHQLVDDHVPSPDEINCLLGLRQIDRVRSGDQRVGGKMRPLTQIIAERVHRPADLLQ